MTTVAHDKSQEHSFNANVNFLLESRISDRYLDFFGIKEIVMVAGLDDTVVLDGNSYDQDDIGSGGGVV